MANDPDRLQLDMTAGGVDIIPLTPSDTADQLPFTQFFRGLVLQTAGAVSIVTVNGSVRTLPSGLLVLGVVHAVPFRRLLATGTTATVWGVP